MFLHSFLDQFLDLNLQSNHQLYFHYQNRCPDQSPFETHIIIDFLFIHLTNLFFSLRLTVRVINIKLFQDKIHFILFFHLFHKAYLKALFL